jgi:KaiC/GvpD/RAD55 family RecA-like ATPase
MTVQLIRSGVPAVDDCLGGIGVNQTTLVVGPARSGKTSFAVGFVCAALRANEPTCMITSDAPEAVIEFSAHFFGFNLRPSLQSRLLTLLSYGPNFQSKVRSLGTPSPPLTEILSVADQRRVRNVVFDTLDPILAAPDLSVGKPFVKSLAASLSCLKATCVCTSSGTGSDTFHFALEEFSFEAATGLDLDHEGEEPRIVVRRSCGADTEGIEIPFRLQVGEGLVASGAPRALSGPPGRVHEALATYLAARNSGAGGRPASAQPGGRVTPAPERPASREPPRAPSAGQSNVVPLEIPPAPSRKNPAQRRGRYLWLGGVAHDRVEPSGTDRQAPGAAEKDDRRKGR